MDEKRIISYKNPVKKKWDIAILIFSVINSFTVPLELSFTELTIFQSIFFIILDNLVDLMFLVDMVLMIFTSYQDRNGIQIFCQAKIIKNYVLSPRFVFDAMAILGTGFITREYPSLKIFKCTKIVRISRLSSLIKKMNQPAEFKATVELFKMIFFLILWVHIVACIWWVVIQEHKDDLDVMGFSLQWYMPVDFLNYPDALLLDESTDPLYQYLNMFYYALLCIGVNEMAPVNRVERGIMSILMLSCILINSQIFGQIAVMV